MVNWEIVEVDGEKKDDSCPWWRERLLTRPNVLTATAIAVILAVWALAATFDLFRMNFN